MSYDMKGPSVRHKWFIQYYRSLLYTILLAFLPGSTLALRNIRQPWLWKPWLLNCTAAINVSHFPCVNFKVDLTKLPLRLGQNQASIYYIFMWMVLQSSAGLTRSSIVRYNINNYRNWGRISVRCWIHKRHPIPRPNGRAMGCILWLSVI